METKEIDHIITRYLNHTADAAEEQLLLNWLKEDKTHQKYFMELRDIWLLSKVPDKRGSAKQAFRHFKNQVVLKKTVHRSNQYARLLQWTVSIAALFILCAGGYFLLHQADRTEYVEIAKTYCKVLMPENCKGAVVLPDSSVVWLNAGSTLIYPENFEPDKRNVTLVGEGYFEVKRNPSAPFQVEAGKMLITVLGTTFNVKSYMDDEVVETVLLTGSVNVKVGEQKVYKLHPNQKISLNTRNDRVSVNTVVGSDYNVWKEQRLSFDNASLGDVLNKLEKWYGVEIICADSLRQNIRLSLTVRNEPVNEMLKMISLIVPIKYEFRGKQNIHIYMSGK
ncbi:FecR family protein [Bacteroides sp.]